MRAARMQRCGQNPFVAAGSGAVATHDRGLKSAYAEVQAARAASSPTIAP
jgi:hypothetical protein